MSAFTEPLAYSATDIFTGGSLHERPVLLSGVPTMVCELVGGRRLYEIGDGFSYDDRRHGTVWIVEPGFQTDLGSIPGIAQWLVSPDAPYAQAFVLHDHLYGMLRDGTAPAWLTRVKADLILWDALGLPFQVRTYDRGELVTHRAICPASLRSAIYYAVRIGGASRAVENSGQPIIPPGV